MEDKEDGKEKEEKKKGKHENVTQVRNHGDSWDSYKLPSPSSIPKCGLQRE